MDQRAELNQAAQLEADRMLVGSQYAAPTHLGIDSAVRMTNQRLRQMIADAFTRGAEWQKERKD